MVEWSLMHVLLGGTIAVMWPLALSRTTIRDRTDRPVRWITWWTWPLAWFGAAAALLEPGPLAVAMATVWLAASIGFAVRPMARFLSRATRNACESAADLAPTFVAFGAVWLLAYAAAVALGGFGPTVVFLTAVHFHVAGGCLLVLAALSGRVIRDRFSRIASGAVILGIPLTAIGISAGGFAEAITGSVMAIAGALVAVNELRAAQRIGTVRSQLLLVASAVSLVVAMGVAAAYAVQGTGHWFGLTVDRMVAIHGVLNSVGFVGLGLLAYVGVMSMPLAEPPGIPFNRLYGRGRIGPEFFARVGAVADDHTPSGLMDALEDFAWDRLSATDTHPAVRDFYERTADYVLVVEPRWNPVFRALYRVYRALIATRVSQTDLPTNSETFNREVTSTILGLRTDVIGQPDPHAWVRTYVDRTDRTLFCAVYTRHHLAGVPYMGIAFPMLRGALTSVLRLEALASSPHPGILLQTTDNTEIGDAGIWFVTPWLPLRLPFTEWIWVWGADSDQLPQTLRTQPAGTTAVAQHRLHMFGLRYLTLDYFIVPSLAPSDETLA